MIRSLKAGVSYFAVVYLAGFALGTLRVLLVAPSVGETAAVLAETPLMLAISWIASGWSTGRLAVPPRSKHRLLMGWLAFVLLMLGELGVSIVVFGRTWEQTLASFFSMPGIIGLSAQVIFAFIPLVQGALQRGAR